MRCVQNQLLHKKIAYSMFKDDDDVITNVSLSPMAVRETLNRERKELYILEFGRALRDAPFPRYHHVQNDSLLERLQHSRRMVQFEQQWLIVNSCQLSFKKKMFSSASHSKQREVNIFTDHPVYGNHRIPSNALCSRVPIEMPIFGTIYMRTFFASDDENRSNQIAWLYCQSHILTELPTIADGTFNMEQSSTQQKNWLIITWIGDRLPHWPWFIRRVHTTRHRLPFRRRARSHSAICCLTILFFFFFSLFLSFFPFCTDSFRFKCVIGVWPYGLRLFIRCAQQ